jgi:sensor histidine kinase regulating citrate/malate metabolism
MAMSVRKLSAMLFLINVVLFLMGVGILFGVQREWIQSSKLLLDLAVAMVLLCSLLSIAGLLSVTRYQHRNYQESLENLEHLNTRLREQRHDYLNQIQIVYGLLELEEYEEARDYLRPVFRDMIKVSRALRTAQPAVNALLQAKMEAAEKAKIDFYLEVGTQLDHLKTEPWEVCKILANLIDNAVTAVSGLDQERKVTVQLEENREEYCIQVRNNGPQITPEQQKLIFSRGYTTKKEEGHGMGLSIVMEVLREAGGTLEMESTAEETVFSFTLPKSDLARQPRMSVQHSDRTV